MTAKDTSTELMALSKILDEVRTRLANMIPDLVQQNADDYLVSGATLAISGLNRYSKNQKQLAENINADKKTAK